MNKTCSLCPNGCKIDKQLNKGVCGTNNDIVIAKYYLHPFEEPVISGKNGSGTIFFCGCSLKCVFLEYACQILDMPKVPELYIQWGYNINAFTVGSENPIIVLNSGLIDMCDDDEIMFIIGHELGHIKSNHMLYHMMASVINMAIESIPGGNLIAAPLQYALYYWNRMSEFTADRAGLLCCQNKDAAIRMFMKMAGMPLKEFNNVNYQSFIKQASEFKMLDEDGMSKLIKFISIANDSHPWTVMRAAELLNWMKQISL